MKKRDIWMNIWQQELKAVIVRYDVAEFRSFYEKWKKRGYYELPLPENDCVLEIAMRKMACGLKGLSEEEKEKARAWLKERGLRTDLGE